MKFMNNFFMTLLALGLSLTSVDAGRERKSVKEAYRKETVAKPKVHANKQLVAAIQEKDSAFKPTFVGNTVSLNGEFLTKEYLENLLARLNAHEDDDTPLTDSELASLNDSVSRLCTAIEENGSEMGMINPAQTIILQDGPRGGVYSTVESIVSENPPHIIVLQDGPREGVYSTVESITSEESKENIVLPYGSTDGVDSILESIASEESNGEKENVVRRIMYAGKKFVIVGVSSTVTTGSLTYLIEKSGLLDISPEAQALGNIVIISAASLYCLFRASRNIERPVQILEQPAQPSFGYRAGALAYRFVSVAALSTLATGTIAHVFTISPAAQALMNLSAITAGGFYLVSSYRGPTTGNSVPVPPVNDIN